MRNMSSIREKNSVCDVAVGSSRAKIKELATITKMVVYSNTQFDIILSATKWMYLSKMSF